MWVLRGIFDIALYSYMYVGVGIDLIPGGCEYTSDIGLVPSGDWVTGRNLVLEKSVR